MLALSYVSLLCGYTAAYSVTEKFYIKEGILLFTITIPIVMFASLDIGDWTSWTMRIILMTTVTFGRFLFAWLISLLNREIVLKFPENGEALCRYVNLWTLVSSLFVLTLQWWLIYS